MSLFEEILPYETLYYFVSSWLTIPQIHSLKQVNRYFYELVKDVLYMKKYNGEFLTSQLKLLQPELTNTIKKITLLDNEMNDMQNRKNELDDLLLKMNETKLMLLEHQSNLNVYVSLFNERRFGEPNVWMIVKHGFKKLNGLERPFKFMLKYSALDLDISDCKMYNISYVLSSLKSKTWFWISKTKNTESQLTDIDAFLSNIGWIKFFALKGEKDTAFVYIHPDEPFLDQIHRTKFHNCPLCNSKIHSLFNCSKYIAKRVMKPTQNSYEHVYGSKRILRKNNPI